MARTLPEGVFQVDKPLASGVSEPSCESRQTGESFNMPRARFSGIEIVVVPACLATFVGS